MLTPIAIPAIAPPDSPPPVCYEVDVALAEARSAIDVADAASIGIGPSMVIHSNPFSGIQTNLLICFPSVLRKPSVLHPTTTVGFILILYVRP